MKRYLLSAITLLSMATGLWAQQQVYISTSFHEPATDGLRFIYSRDGWQWQQVDGIIYKFKADGTYQLAFPAYGINPNKIVFLK